MAEVKNSFIKSKMNKDLDARLLPNGEYREGVNIQVSKSEGSDVGALENVLGNQSLIDFSSAAYTGIPNLHTIGMFTNNLDNNIYIFLTDYNELNLVNYNVQNLNYSSSANNFIYVYNTTTNVVNKLVSGSFLNFSTNFPINSVNILEDVLFWTDNRNQPRKINVSSALGSYENSAGNIISYYTTEDQISVATYAPFQSIQLYYKDDSLFLSNGGSGITNGITALGSTTIVLTASGFAGINPSNNSNGSLIGAKLTTSTGTGLAADAVLVSYSPTTITVAAAKVTASIPDGTTIYFNQNTLSTANQGQYVTSMIDASSPMNPGEAYDPASRGATTNRNYNPNYNGDPDFLEDKFVRFSYRFKFEDGEDSIMAPFTQPAFIPKQDGYFLPGDEEKSYRSTVVDFMENKVNNIFLQIPLPLDSITSEPIAANEIGDALKISEIEILYKESDSQAVQVVDSIPRFGNNGFEVLGRNSDGTFDTTLSYNYQGTKPYKTLPTAALIRVYDKVPVRALGQEIISNRIVYSNFQDKHTPIASLNYNVGVSTKYLSFVVSETGNPVLGPVERTSIREYPMHTLKQNRNYQVGIVLSDKFGRSSTTILSSASTQGNSVDPNDSGLTLVGDTVYFPYNDISVDTALSPSINNINAWPGDSLKVLFNEPIDQNTTANPTNGWPGIYNGDQTNPNYNPLGWYSYKIVVKQQEQEYYNVYLPGILNGYPAKITSPPDPVNTISTITLINDNINKVPRDLTEVGPEQKQFRSAVQLYGRVTPNESGQPTFNKAFNPGIISDTVSAIGVQDQLLQAQAVPANLDDYIEIYQTESNPSLARLTQTNISNPIGSLPDSSSAVNYNLLLGIYETTPFESLIDIYYETSTTGTVAELNNAIGATSSGIRGFTTNTDMTIASDTWKFNLYEDITPGSSPTSTYDQATGIYTVLEFFPYISTNAGLKSVVINSNINLDSTGFWVTNGENPAQDVTSKFQLLKIEGQGTATNPDKYYITITDNTFFSYQENSPVVDSFNFNFRVENLDNENPAAGEETQYGTFTNVTLTEKLENLIPIITGSNTIVVPVGQTGDIHTFVGNNGSAAPGGLNQENLTWGIISQTPAVGSPGAVTLALDSRTGVLSEDTGKLIGRYEVTVSLTDAGTNSTTLGGTPTATLGTVVTGSSGYETVDINTTFYQVKNILINQGPESSGFYWAPEQDNPITSTPLPETNREPTTGLANTTIGATGVNRITVQSTATPQSGGAGNCNNWNWINTNRNGNILAFQANSGLNIAGVNGNADWTTSYSLNSAAQTGLNTGSAYILIDYYQSQIDTSIIQDQPSIIWPTFLQYRATPQESWTTARDVEGRECKFGGTQANNYSVCPDTGIFTQEEGVKDKRSKSKTSGAGGENGFNENDSFETFVKGKVNIQSPDLATTGSKLFVVGRNQAYRDLAGDVSSDPNSDNPPDYMGEYRLIVRYPSGENIEVNGAERIIPVLTPTSCPPIASGYSNEVLAAETQQVRLSFGDFFTPTQLIAKFNNNTREIPSSGTVEQRQSFSYRVSNNSGYDDRSNAEDDNPSLQVFAREWAFRYVTQFYTDQALTTPWIPPGAGSTRWYAYKGFYEVSTTSNGWLSVNVKYGNENSNTRRQGSPIFQDNITGTTIGLNDKDLNRKWTAQFDQFGKKIIRTAEPCVAELTETDLGPVFPPGGYQSGGQYSITRLNSTSFIAVWDGSTPGNFFGVYQGNASSFANKFIAAGSTPVSQGQIRNVSGVTNPLLAYYTLNKVGEGYTQVGSINVGASASVTWDVDGNQAFVKITNCTSVSDLGVIIDNYIWVGLN